MRITLSLSPNVANWVPCGWKAMPEKAKDECGSARIATVVQSEQRQMRTVPSADFDARKWLFAENETDVTGLVCAAKVVMASPVVGCQRRTVWS